MDSIMEDIKIPQKRISCQYMMSDKSKFQVRYWEQEMYRRLSEIEEKVCIAALEEFLRRDSTSKDYEKCKRVFREGIHDSYEFLFEDIKLGTVSRVFEGNKITVKFTPLVPAKN